MKAILTWHAIDESRSPISVSREVFADQVAFLASGRVRVVPLGSILTESGDAVALTFDDAFTSFSEVAWPALRDAGLPATVFVTIALSGFCALAAEVVWTRILSLLLGATVYTFAIILAVFLLGLALGSSAGAAVARTLRRPNHGLACCQLRWWMIW